MMQSISEASPGSKARIAGVLYLLTILTGVFALSVSSGLVVSSDAAATSANILAHQRLFRLAFAANLFMFACYVAVTSLFYSLFKPVNSGVSLIAALFSVVGCAIGALSCAFDLAPLFLLGSAPYVSGFSLQQLQSLALIFLKIGGRAFDISLVFFGFYCLLVGYLIYRSTFLPRILGVLMALAGLGGLTYLAPPLAHYLSTYVSLASLVGEGSLTMWLLVKGVNVPRWEKRASAAGSGRF